MISLSNLKSVMTPLGVGQVIGVDNRENPTSVTALVRVEGKKLRVAKAFSIDEISEVETNKTGGNDG
jgi:hypothetical protein